MKTQIVGAHNYRFVKMDVWTQFHVMRRMMGLISGLGPSTKDGGKTDFWMRIVGGLSKMPREEAEDLIKMALSGVQREMPGGQGFAPIITNGVMMYDDLELVDMMTLATVSSMENLDGFFGILRSLLPRPVPGAEQTTPPSSSQTD